MAKSETLIEFLVRALKNGLVECSVDSSVTLVEKGDNVDMAVLIDQIPCPFAVLRPDPHLGHLPCVKQDRKLGMRVACDYLLILDLPGGHRVILVELKTTLRNEAYRQLQRSLAVVAYLEALYFADSQQDIKLSSVDCAVIYERRRDKPGIRPARHATYEGIKIRTLQTPGPYPISSLMDVAARSSQS